MKTMVCTRNFVNLPGTPGVELFGVLIFGPQVGGSSLGGTLQQLGFVFGDFGASEGRLARVQSFGVDVGAALAIALAVSRSASQLLTNTHLVLQQAIINDMGEILLVLVGL